jgi:metaxin
MATRFQLMCYGPSWGCPSLDAASSKAHAWMLFCGLRQGVDFEVNTCGNPHVGMTGELPVLAAPGASPGTTPTLAEPHEIFSTLAALGHDPDSHLDAVQKAESAAYAALIEERLHCALLFSWWEDEANYEAVVRPALAAMLPLPLCYYLPWSMRKRVHSQLARRRCASATIAYGHGEAALEALAARLAAGGAAYFHGATPTGIDASLFAYLTAVLRCPLPKDRLRRKLREYPQLVSYCERISAEYFGGSEPLLPAVSGALAEGGVAGAAAARRRAAAMRAGGAEGAQAAAEEAAERGTEADESAEGDAAAKPHKEPRSQKQQAFRRRSRNAVIGSGVVAVLYALAVGALGRDAEEEEEEDS